jgi:hypothetical protein
MGRYGSYVNRYTEDGHLFAVWETDPLARIQDDMLNSVLYLYKSEAAAKAGDPSGGSGFLVGIDSAEHYPQQHVYAVTATHVIAGCPVVRLTSSLGETLIHPFKDSDWIRHPDGHDIAICPLPLPSRESVSAIPVEKLITKEVIELEGIGPGDDAFIIGRFIAYGGKKSNAPSVRFGNISMMPGEPVVNPKTGAKQECFLVESHTISGYSGSPVFVQILPNTMRPIQHPAVPLLTLGHMAKDFKMWLLGIDHGHLPHFDDVVDARDKRHPDGWRVRSNSAMMAVIPAWKIKEILESEEFMKQRQLEDERFGRELTKANQHIVLDTKEPEFTKEDFENALKRASRRIQPLPPDEEKSKT